MRSDLKLNYNALDSISKKLARCYLAIEEIQVELSELQSLLENQDSQAYKMEVKKIQATNISFGKRKTTILMLKNNLEKYVEDMEQIVGAVNRSIIVRVDKNDICYNIKTMDGLAQDLSAEFKNTVTGMNYPVTATEDAETKSIRTRAENNYKKLEKLRTEKLVPLSNYVNVKMEELWKIYNQYIVSFEDMDDTYRKEINSIYRKRTSEKDKRSNNWDFALSVGTEFLSKFIGAFLITAAIISAPTWATVGALAVLAIGCVVLTSVPEQSVPSWLQGAKDIADRIAQLSVRALDEGPLVFVDAIGQGIADQVQTPTGIAALAGEVTGGAVGARVGTKYKSYLKKKKLNVDTSESKVSVHRGTKTGKVTILDGNYSTSEINAAQYVADLGNEVVLRPPVGTRAGGQTSDLLVNGVNYDVYTPTTNNPSAIIRAITKKNTQTTGIVLDLSHTTVTADDLGNILSRVKGAIETNGGVCNINDIIIMPK